MGDGHDHGGANRRALTLALAITGAFLVVEAVGGWLTGSLALVADAGHMLIDVAALALSLFALTMAARPATHARTYGWKHVEVLAAAVNGVGLVAIALYVAWEAVARLDRPEPVEGGPMLLVAAGGLVANLVAMRILRGGHGDSLNVRGAYLHVLGDLLASVGTVGAALIIRFTGWTSVDPLASIVMTGLIVRGAWTLVRESVDVLLESTPSHISIGAVRAQLEAIPGIESVHDLHIWTVTSGMVAMSAHAVVPDPVRNQHVLEHVLGAMRLFGIGHVTVQIEQRKMEDCEHHLHQ